MLCNCFIRSLFGAGLQTLVAQFNYAARFVKYGFSFVKTDIKKLHQIIDRGVCQRVNVVDSVFRQRIGLRCGDHRYG